MMANKWFFICITGLLIVKHMEAKKPAVRQGTSRQATARLPQSKPTVTKPKHTKDLEERRLGQDYIEQYQEMLKASQESFEAFDERDDKRLRRLIGNDDLGLMAEAGAVGGRRRGRSGGRLPGHSEAGRRRQRSQALRREKLNVQSATSHKRHSRANYIHYIQNQE